MPPTPIGRVSKSTRLSWPFSARRASGKAIHMRKIRVPVLSTVIESPRPSPQVPVISVPLEGDHLALGQSQGRLSSDQSLLRYHPAFRKPDQYDTAENAVARSENLRRSLTAKPVTVPEIRVRPNRSKSVIEIPLNANPDGLSYFPRPALHTRSVSQSSGNAPDAPVPPLPLKIAQIKTQEHRLSLLSRSPSVSSHDSGNTAILTTKSSPILPRSTNIRVQKGSVQKGARRDWRSSMIVGPRPLRDTLTLHGRNQNSESSIKSSIARISMAPETTQSSQAGNRSSTITNSSSSQSLKVKTAASVTMSRVSSPAQSPVTVRSHTPQRKSGSYVTAYGSPEERAKGSSALRDASELRGWPTRQLSQA
jgi:hypothetical protein